MTMRTILVLGKFFTITFFLFPDLSFSFDPSERENSVKKENSVSRLRNEVHNTIKRLRAAYNEETKLLRQQTSTISNELQNFSEILQVILNQNSELKNEIVHLQKENKRIKNAIKKLEILIGEEQNARVEADQNIVTEVSTEISQIVSQMNTSTTLVSSNTSSQTSGSYSIYEVVKGDTLGAISMAFDVSLKQLMAFNHLTETTILVGQKIKIPEK